MNGRVRRTDPGWILDDDQHLIVDAVVPRGDILILAWRELGRSIFARCIL